MRALFIRYFPEWGPIALRFALGTVFMAHGWGKITGPVGTPEGFNIEGWGWPAPLFWAWAVALVETFGGLCVVVGLLTRLSAFLIACVMAVAILQVRLQQGFVGGFEFEFTLLMVAIALVLAGPGRLSVDRDILGWGIRPRAEAHRRPEEAP
jgi:putative oxidoreductase